MAMSGEEGQLARQVVDRMYTEDAFSQWLGIERLQVLPGYCKLRMTVRPEMLNGFGIAHGGITFSLADSAFAFASNSRGPQAVSVETGISHLRPVRPGDVLQAEATELHRSRSLGRYRVDVSRADGELVALFTGTVFLKPS